ncbi:hypothetical protein Fot_07720 [Forsythia ovata]|uniref:Uncharacterized protein n=1 Tax=Forsythia ovata TaxID=205694 RepID=A0ABD1WWM4_9LAMI
MARARDNHTQQRYNHGGLVNPKPPDGRTRHQIRHRQGTHQRPFPGTRSNYAAEIIEPIPNSHTGMNASNQEMLVGKVGPRKSKKQFTSLYCAYHRFYRYRTEDCRDKQTLAEQETQKKDHPSFRGNKWRNIQ